MQTGPVQVQIDNQGFKAFILNGLKNDFVLTLRDEKNDYTLKIPKESKYANGKITVNPEGTEQNANLIIEEIAIPVNSIQTEELESCYYTSYGSCGHECRGHKTVRYRVDRFNRSFKLKIHNDEGSAEIKTTEKLEEDRTPLENLTPCQ